MLTNSFLKYPAVCVKVDQKVYQISSMWWVHADIPIHKDTNIRTCNNHRLAFTHIGTILHALITLMTLQGTAAKYRPLHRLNGRYAASWKSLLRNGYLIILETYFSHCYQSSLQHVRIQTHLLEARMVCNTDVGSPSSEKFPVLPFRQWKKLSQPNQREIIW